MATFTGTAGNDALTGGAEGDTLFGLAGNDVLNGGAQPAGVFDLANYSGANAGSVSVDLATGVATDGLGGTDTLINIEGAIGGEASDTLLGSNILADFFIGQGGNDIIDGRGNPAGARNADFVSYNSSPLGVDIDLVTGVALDGFGGTDTLRGIEAIQGSVFNDILRGDAQDNFLFGFSGNDTLDGRGGADTISYFFTGVAGVTVDLVKGTASGGTSGSDFLISIENVDGSGFADTLLGNELSNIFVAFGGNDTLRGFGGQDFLGGYGGNDILDGGANEFFFGDSAFYFNTGATSAVTVDLAAGAASDGLGGTDTLIGIEGANGTVFNDTLLGDANGGNFFEGYGGNDTIDGRGDSGVSGFGDTVLYNNSPAGVTVDLAAGTASDGWGGADTIRGMENIQGSAFADILRGDSIDNTLTGGVGNDTLDGRDGSDNASYFSAKAGVTVDLAAGTASDGDGGTDTLISIERASGSAFADTLLGSDGDNILQGQAGNDILNGRGGIDAVSYLLSTAGVTVNLATGTASDGLGGTDTLISIENAGGSEFADTITGTDGVNLFFGRGGNDFLTGGSGIDTAQYQGGRGNYLVINAGNNRSVLDTATNRDGSDTLIGVERLKFADSFLAFDNSRADNAGKGLLLLFAAFERAPDAAVLGKLINDLDLGKSFGDAAASVLASPEFVTQNGANLSNQAFVNLLYDTVLDRVPEATGNAFWLGALNGGFARSDMLAIFATLDENVSATAPLRDNGIFYTLT